jgi:hypothetical protein
MKVHAFATALVLSATLAACSDPTQPAVDPLLDLDAGEALDVSDKLAPPSDASGALVFHGYVMTIPPAGSDVSSDSLNKWPRVPNVVITVYELAGRDGNQRPVAGKSLGSTTSDGVGYFRFTSPLADGEYVLASVPPAGSGLKGTYWSYFITASQANRLIGIVLPK